MFFLGRCPSLFWPCIFNDVLSVPTCCRASLVLQIRFPRLYTLHCTVPSLGRCPFVLSVYNIPYCSVVAYTLPELIGVQQDLRIHCYCSVSSLGDVPPWSVSIIIIVLSVYITDLSVPTCTCCCTSLLLQLGFPRLYIFNCTMPSLGRRYFLSVGLTIRSFNHHTRTLVLIRADVSCKGNT